MDVAAGSEALEHEVLAGARPRTALTVWASGPLKHSTRPIDSPADAKIVCGTQETVGARYPPPLVVESDGPEVDVATGALRLALRFEFPLTTSTSY